MFWLQFCAWKLFSLPWAEVTWERVFLSPNHSGSGAWTSNSLSEALYVWRPEIKLDNFGLATCTRFRPSFDADRIWSLEPRSLFYMDSGGLQNVFTQPNHFSPKLTTLFLQTALANKPPILQIFPCSKFEINLFTDWKVMARKLTFSQRIVSFLP